MRWPWSAKLGPRSDVDEQYADCISTRRTRGPDIQPYKYSHRYTINKIVYKIFGAMSKDLYIEISAHLSIESVENLVANRRNRFYRAMLCIRGTRHDPVSVRLSVCLSVRHKSVFY